MQLLVYIHGLLASLQLLATCSRACHPCACSNDYGLIDADCSLRALIQIPASIPDAVARLNVSGNLLVSIVPGTFMRFPNLTELDLSSNVLTQLDDDSFSGLSLLISLNLDSNPLPYSTAYAPGSIRQLRKLEKLHLITDDCPSQLPHDLIDGLTSLTELAVSIGRNATFGNGFRSLVSLDTLYVTSPGCSSQTLSLKDVNTLKSLPIRRLSLRNIGFTTIEPAVLLTFNRTLKKLDLSCNKLQNTPAILSGLANVKLHTLLMDRSIDTFTSLELTSDTLSSLSSTNLTVLSIAGNRFLDIGIDRNYIKYSLDHLRYIRLGYNQVILRSLLSRDEMLIASVLLFRNVRVVDASGLFNFYTDRYEASSLLECTTQDVLFSAEHQDWEDDVLLYHPPRESAIVWLSKVAIRLAMGLITMPPFLTRIYMQNIGGGNYATVTCSNKKIYKENNIQRLYISGPTISCLSCNDSGLSALTTVGATNLKLQRWNRPFFSSNSTPRLQSLNLEGNDLAAFLEDGGVGGGLDADMFHNLTDLNLSYNNIKRLPQCFLTNAHSLSVLNLSHNVMDAWETSLPASAALRMLDLSHNRLSTLSELMRQELDSHRAVAPEFTVRLLGNEITCSCNNIKFLQWLLETSVTHFVTECSGDSGDAQLIDTNLLRLLKWRCESSIVLIACLSAASAGLLLFGVCTACKWRLKYLYYRIRRLLRSFESNVHEENIAIYVSHSDYYGDSVLRLLEFLELNMSVGTVVTREKLEVGYYEYDQIALHIDTCHVTVLLISAQGLNDPKVEFEFYMAIQKGMHCVLPIVMTEDLPLDQMPRALRKLLSVNNYLKWPNLTPGAGTVIASTVDAVEWSRFTTVLEASMVNILDRLRMSHACIRAKAAQSYSRSCANSNRELSESSPIFLSAD